MYKFAPKLERAKIQLFSWFEAVGIPCRDVPDQLALTVQAKTGTSKVVSINVPNEVQQHPCPVPKYPGDLTIEFADIRAPNLTDAKNAFAKLTQALGYGALLPVDRGTDLNDRDFDLYTMRHKEFRRSPNPTPEFFEKYRTIVQKAVNHFYYPNQAFCARVGMDRDDIMAYAWLYAITYEANFRVLTVTKNDNIRLLTNHLKQRLGALQKRFQMRAKKLCSENVDDIDKILNLSTATHEGTFEPSEALYSNLRKLPKPLAIQKLNQAVEQVKCKRTKKLALSLLSQLSETGRCGPPSP